MTRKGGLISAKSRLKLFLQAADLFELLWKVKIRAPSVLEYVLDLNTCKLNQAFFPSKVGEEDGKVKQIRGCLVLSGPLSV